MERIQLYLKWRATDDASSFPVDAGGEIDCLTRTDVQGTLQSLNDLFKRVRFVIIDGCCINRSVQLRSAWAEITSIHWHRSAIAFFDLHKTSQMKYKSFLLNHTMTLTFRSAGKLRLVLDPSNSWAYLSTASMTILQRSPMLTAALPMEN